MAPRRPGVGVVVVVAAVCQLKSPRPSLAPSLASRAILFGGLPPPHALTPSPYCLDAAFCLKTKDEVVGEAVRSLKSDAFEKKAPFGPEVRGFESPCGEFF